MNELTCLWRKNTLPVDTGNHEYQKTIVDYYSLVGMDYEPWSHDLNMHFGYFRRGMNPFDRESLLNEMTDQVVERLSLDETAEQRVLDLGCGVGTSMRYIAKQRPNIHLHGLTIVPWQIEQAKRLSSTESYSARIHYQLADYSQAPFSDQRFDGAYAIESSCYDHGSDKKGFLKEAYRLLKPGSRLVVADGFTKSKQANPVFEYAYKQVCRGWSLETFADINDFIETMKSLGFQDIQVEEISWKVLPSVLHVPWVSIKYFFTHLLTNKGNKHFQRLHLIAPMMGLIIGLHRQSYGYYLVSAKR